MKRYSILFTILLTLFSLSCSSNPDVETQSLDVESSKDYSVDLGNGVELEMVWIPGGTFLIGSPLSEEGRRENEGPQTEVTLEGFWMGKYEVTQEQYEEVMGVNPSFVEGADHPVESVSWYDAIDFCEELMDMTGMEYILPTEAQWEYACRAGSTGACCFGDDLSQLSMYAWYGENEVEGHHPVGEKELNEFGLYDMHGNVWEWCLSRYQAYPYSETDGRNNLDVILLQDNLEPTDLDDLDTLVESSDNLELVELDDIETLLELDKYVLRGGAYREPQWACRCASRFRIFPFSDFGSDAGFRIVRNP